MRDHARDFYDLLHALNPSQFQKNKVDCKPGQSLTTLLHTSMQPITLRRLSENVALPRKVEIIVPIEMTPTQANLYGNILKTDPLIEGKTSEETIAKLHQVINHPYLLTHDRHPTSSVQITPDLVNDSAKLLLLDKLLLHLHAHKNRVLIFSHHLGVLNVLDSYLSDRKYTFLRIDSQLGYLERNRRVVLFNQPESPFFCALISTGVGFEGINLKSADTVIIHDVDPEPQVDFGAAARAYCIGQQKSVLVLKFMTRCSVEAEYLQSIAKHTVSRYSVMHPSPEVTSAEAPEITKISEMPDNIVMTDIHALLDRQTHHSVLTSRSKQPLSQSVNTPQLWVGNKIEPVAEFSPRPGLIVNQISGSENQVALKSIGGRVTTSLPTKVCFEDPQR
jgi:hypothetical protein